MNARVSRFLRRWRHHSKISNRQSKRAWNLVPGPERHGMKKRLELEMSMLDNR